MQRLHIPAAAARKFRFVDGDIEKPGFGLAAGELTRLRTTLTHVVHCAASVSFDDTYENSFRANVLGCRNALEFSLGIQRARGSTFVSHVAIETSYIHGRRKRSIAQESALSFPAHFYNNFYELTKAMASIETDRAMVERGPAGHPAPALHRDRPFAHREQPRRHQGGERAHQRVRPGQGGPGLARRAATSRPR